MQPRLASHRSGLMHIRVQDGPIDNRWVTGDWQLFVRPRHVHTNLSKYSTTFNRTVGTSLVAWGRSDGLQTSYLNRDRRPMALENNPSSPNSGTGKDRVISTPDPGIRYAGCSQMSGDIYNSVTRTLSKQAWIFRMLRIKNALSSDAHPKMAKDMVK